jgi:hypothetical protein
MKAITIRHPFPWCICYLGKPLENRDWIPSPVQLRPGEQFGIHAGKMVPAMELQNAFASLFEMGAINQDTKLPAIADLRSQESAIVAVVTYGGAVTSHPSRWFTGRYGWVMDKLIVLPKPVPCRGAQGLWEVPADVLEKMREQFR